MGEYSSLQRKVDHYHNVLDNIVAYRKAWREGVQQHIVASLKELMEAVGLSGSIRTRERIANLAAVTVSLGNVSSGMAKEVTEGVTREMLKHNGSLIYQQLFNGKIAVAIRYPQIEEHGKPKPNKTLAIFRPEELRAPYFQRHLETFITEITNWEDLDDEPNQKIGFRMNFEQKELEESDEPEIIIPEASAKKSVPTAGATPTK